ncbi:MAG: peptidase E [Candidatus Saccharimonadales bacterium]|jgi:peptidase E
MKQVVLFSTITDTNSQTILSEIFNDKIKDKVLAYMPSDGVADSAIYIKKWRSYAQRFGAGFNVVNNHSSDEIEKVKLLDSNILLISGGNTFALLNNLCKSGLDQAVIEFTQKPNFILSGFSAGALILTPTIAICNLPNFDENLVGITNFDGLGIIDFEVFPHYVDDLHKKIIKNYRSTTRFQVREISDEDFITVSMQD